MIKLVIIVIGILLMASAVSVVSAAPIPTQTLPTGQTLRISAENGENFIQWSWKSETGQTIPPLNIVLDNAQTPIITNYTADTYLVSKVNEGKHNVALYNGTAWAEGSRVAIGKSTTMTLRPAYQIYGVLGITIFLLLISFLFRELIRLLLVSVLNIIICVFGWQIALNYGAVAYLFIGIGAVTGILMLINGLPKIREEISWF